MRRHSSRRSREVNAELNITAFMNLMVVLVPFLLITAVFSQVSILNLNLPGTSSPSEPSDEPVKALEVIVRSDRLEIVKRERGTGNISTIDNTDAGYDFKKLNELLVGLKASENFRDETSITLLLEEDIEYDVLVQTMDAVRLMTSESQDDGVTVITYGELFPDVSIGSAPPAYDNNAEAR